MKILSLHEFDAPSFDDLATVALIEDNLEYCDYEHLSDELQPFSKYLREYPEVSIAPDILATRETARAVWGDGLFLPVHDSIFKKIASTCREKGLTEAICLAASTEPEEITPVLHWIVTRLKWVLDLIDRGTNQREDLPTSGSGSVADIVHTRDWETSLIRSIAWHPHCPRLAVVTRDDRIRIFSQGIPVVPILRHSAQKSICCISWRPLASRELAVACHTGVLVWTIELGAASNSLSHAILLKQRNHAPVTSVTWHPQGDLLVSCSSADTHIIIWDTSKREGVPLRRVGGGGLCFTRWSSCGSRLFSASCRNIFRVWNTGVATSWHAEKWTVPNGRVAVACFGPNLTLLFASNEDPAMIFSLPLQENIFDVKKSSSDDAKMATPLIDLTKVNFSSNGDYVAVGGRIVAMEWDPTGRYLAILFQDSPWVAIIKTKLGNLSRVVEIKPSCLVKGFPGEIPSCMNFYQKYKEDSNMICLTIAWSSGRIQHFPIIEKETVPVVNVSCLSHSYSLAHDTYNFNLRAAF
ncbi:aladin-like [Ceratina calcarata]|uniref:Aladin-like n=1 Tax=Ceratina calcarata TaxID=156304 RepID=A0AAJ7S742_9HYME|nr:aladin-like [Ceratina calcarata]XP_017883418.1 aladin-like [Ceratina calcarata]XP_026672703.1 aladin-like [Ceratina calcarata]